MIIRAQQLSDDLTWSDWLTAAMLAVIKRLNFSSGQVNESDDWNIWRWLVENLKIVEFKIIEFKNCWI